MKLLAVEDAASRWPDLMAVPIRAGSSGQAASHACTNSGSGWSEGGYRFKGVVAGYHTEISVGVQNRCSGSHGYGSDQTIHE